MYAPGLNIHFVVGLVPVPDLLAHEVLPVKLAVPDPTQAVLVIHAGSAVMRFVRIHGIDVVFFHYEARFDEQLRYEGYG